MAFRIYMLNFNYFLDKEFPTIAEAKEHARNTGYEILVYDNNTVIGSITGVTKTWTCFHSDYHFVE